MLTLTFSPEWLKTLDYSTLDSMKGGDYADVIATFASSPLGMTQFELKLSGNDATDYCTTMHTDDGVTLHYCVMWHSPLILQPGAGLPCSSDDCGERDDNCM